MRQLIEDAVVADGIQILVKEVPLFSKEFDEKIEALKSEEAKASEMEHALRHEIHIRLEENPVFYQSLRERLEEIIERRRHERLDAAEQLKLFQQLMHQIEGEQKIAQDLGLSPTGFAIYGLLEHSRPSKVADSTVPYGEPNRELAGLIHEAIDPLTDLVDWWQKDDIQREMRKKIKRHLRASGMETVRIESLASEIVDLAKVRQER